MNSRGREMPKKNAAQKKQPVVTTDEDRAWLGTVNLRFATDDDTARYDDAVEAMRRHFAPAYAAAYDALAQSKGEEVVKAIDRAIRHVSSGWWPGMIDLMRKAAAS
jgi:hypothetical protein